LLPARACFRLEQQAGSFSTYYVSRSVDGEKFTQHYHQSPVLSSSFFDEYDHVGFFIDCDGSDPNPGFDPTFASATLLAMYEH
jgi:hypothetical protein